MSSQVSRAIPETDTTVASPISGETSSDETLQTDSAIVSSSPEASTASEGTSTPPSDSFLPVDPVDAEGVSLSTHEPGSSVPADFLRDA